VSAKPAQDFLVSPLRMPHDWKAAFQRAAAYLAALGIAEPERTSLAAEAVQQALQGHGWSSDNDASTATLACVRQLLPQIYPPIQAGAVGDLPSFSAWSVDAYLHARFTGGVRRPTPLRAPARSMPRLNRRAMVPEPIERRASRRLLNRLLGRPSQDHTLRGNALRRERSRLPWVWAARRRRVLLMLLVLVPSIIASGFMVNVLPHQGKTWLEVAIVLFFGALFGWISIGFWTALFGFYTLMRKRDEFVITNLDPRDAEPLSGSARTAIVMPICEEPVERVFAGLQAIYESLEKTGQLAHFDFFILSDSHKPSTCIQEEEAWADWCRRLGRFDRVFYRRRKVRLKRKSGNVADFVRRWGKSYPYMIMLDADSIMAGETLVRLVQMMERNPTVGMIQTAPVAVNRSSLLARAQQFAGRVYGPMFAAGLHFWQLGDGQYWGHNTILRVAPFADHCGLPRLPGKPPLGGEIMSHDFVEAALMGRAGWTLWLAFDLGGSYEEVPSTLLEEMSRDRRWCQGNLQHLRLMFSEGLFGAHRALFVNGVLSYVSALLWFTFLSLSTAEAILDALQEPEYFPHGPSLFPEWPIWRPDWAIALLSVTAAILFLPKVLSIGLIWLKERRSASFGGTRRMVTSVVLEVILSSLLAPIRMVFHSRFVVQNLLGRTVQWTSQGRDDQETGWSEALRHHGFDTLFASAWGLSLFWLNPDYFWWIMPIIGALILSVPLSVLASRTRLGVLARRLRLFLIPEEVQRPAELRSLDEILEARERAAERVPELERDGFVRAVVDPYVNAWHRLLIGGERRLKPSVRARRREWMERALESGPDALDVQQRKVLLRDPTLMVQLHERVWALPRDRAALWGRPGGRPLDA